MGTLAKETQRTLGLKTGKVISGIPTKTTSQLEISKRGMRRVS